MMPTGSTRPDQRSPSGQPATVGAVDGQGGRRSVSVVRFTLTYDGPLHIGNKAPGKQHVRAHLHPQVRELWDFPPLTGDATAGMLTWQGRTPSESGERGLS